MTTVEMTAAAICVLIPSRHLYPQIDAERICKSRICSPPSISISFSSESGAVDVASGCMIDLFQTEPSSSFSLSQVWNQKPEEEKSDSGSLNKGSSEDNIRKGERSSKIVDSLK
ncbi:uncharacterized protein G2W53_035240 [Senna tora]|uniref:Uncharacterized protein n=1 Tax=Senna tora TaxID=362788 RepID=A0A834SRE7_9FABA|nr:uncharacterized protein G2W53_035240 [Senna tora]